MHPIRRRRIILVPSGITYDADAQIFFDAVVANSGLLDGLEKGAYNVSRIDSKNNADPWNGDTHLDYPMLGSTVESMVINAQNPGTFDATAVNTVGGDFTANGWTPSGASYFRTGLIPLTHLSANSVTFFYYSRDDTGENGIDMGAYNNSTTNLALQIKRVTSNLLWDCYSDNLPNGRISVVISSSAGGISATRTTSNHHEVYRNGSSLAQATGTEGNRPSVEIYIGARNTGGGPFVYTTKECAGTLIGNGFSDNQVLAQYTACQLLNTNCIIGGREV